MSDEPKQVDPELEHRLALLEWNRQMYRETERPSYNHAVDMLLKDPDVRAADPNPKFPDKYSVRTRQHHQSATAGNLTFHDGLQWIQERFEQSDGAVHFASIELQG